MARKTSIPDKVIKYHKARLAGHNKKESVAIAGYSPKTLSTDVERMDSYKSISIANDLLKQIGQEEIVAEHLNMLRQDEDKAIKMQAIKLAYERIEPETNIKDDVEIVEVTVKK